MATLNIYSTEWLDVVFSERNKAYGAYELRRNNSKSTSKALWTGSLLFILAVLLPPIIRHFSEAQIADQDRRIVVDYLPPETVKPKPLPAQPEPPKSRNEQVKFPPMVVVDHDVTEEPATITKLIDADPGLVNTPGNVDAAINIDIPQGIAQQTDRIVEHTDDLFNSGTVQILPQYPGGKDAWAKFMQGYRYPPAAVENGVSGIVYVSFVVEKDGSLTDIKVERDAGFGTGEEAVRLLKTSIKWHPGIQNGRKVRVAYTQPISLNIN